MSDEQLTGHAVTFLTAGFEGMTNTMLYTLYEISKHQEIQDKIRQEILNNLNNQDGGEDLNYDVIKKLNYMEQCIKEAMRKYSPSPMLMRMCTKDYTFPNGYTINAGEHVIIPIRYIHYNPKYYPDPEKYDPERFNPDNNLRSCAFIPFGDGPRICIGNALPVILRSKSLGQHLADLCKKYPNEELIGYYDFMSPTLLINDVETIERILIKDFVHFTDHGFPVDEERNPLDANIFNMTGKRWKAVRNKLSPVFTTGKLRLMFDSIAECGDRLVKQLENRDEAEMRDVLGRFAMDVIGSCAFGLEAKNLEKPDNEFRKMTKGAFEKSTLILIQFIIMTHFPALNKLFNFTFRSLQDSPKYYTGVIRDTMKYRRENGYKRNDFLQLMIQLQDKGYVEMLTKDPDDDYLGIDKNELSTEKFELNNEQITGLALTFLTAGFEGVTWTMMYSLYELSKEPEIQEKVRQEIMEQVKKAGSLSYDAIREMTYLEQCIKEAMRINSLGQNIFRVCTKDYTFPNGLEIKVNQRLIISMLSVHYNETYFPEPEKFAPERFDPDNSIPPCTYMPFGNGPRMCIAMRFALLEVKYCIAKLLMNYRFRISPKTKEPLTVNPRSILRTPKERVIFTITKV
ncbi:hypothetical protein O3M35_012509 [Rhynocoris fuscipes]|uniref:Cytochrome P450 n=1 Tax=Rhynocoris fuscipes TaxID=488301 RepID=A0AAW1CYB4_9HEMI